MNEKQKPAAPHLKMKVVTEAKCFLSTETCLNKSYSGAIVVAEQSVCPALLIKKQKSNTAALKKWFESHWKTTDEKWFVSAKTKLWWAFKNCWIKKCVGLCNYKPKKCVALKTLRIKNCMKVCWQKSLPCVALTGFCQTIFLDGVCCPPKLLLNKNQEKKKSTKATLKTFTLMGATNSVFKLMKSRSGLACNVLRLGVVADF